MKFLGVVSFSGLDNLGGSYGSYYVDDIYQEHTGSALIIGRLQIFVFNNANHSTAEISSGDAMYRVLLSSGSVYSWTRWVVL